MTIHAILSLYKVILNGIYISRISYHLLCNVWDGMKQKSVSRDQLILEHGLFLHVEISTGMSTFWNRRGILQWIFQHLMMIESCSNVLDTLSVANESF